MPTLCPGAIRIALRSILPIFFAALAGQARAAPDPACADDARRPAARLELRVDNDLFGGDQDQGYSNGVLVTATSSDLSDIDASGMGGCHWAATRWLARRLGALGPDGADRRHLNVSFAQAIFTPSDRDQSALIADDRPYAAALLLGLGYDIRSGNRLQTSRMQIGIVGPAARGEQAQNGIHKVIGDEPFRGWNNQLRDEGVFRLAHERLRRHAPRPSLGDDAWRWDGISHWGVSLGNLATYLEVGGELRWGPRLPDDFGTSPVRPAGVHAPTSTALPADAGFRAHGFASMQARWVVRDISLDGNTFKSSHRVDKEPLVAEFGYGLAMTYGPWKVVIARYHRTREFRGQKELPIFGSISISRAF